MKIIYVTKQLPYGDTEAFILPEVASHQAQGWEVWLAPTQSGALYHDAGAALLPRTLQERLLSPRVLASFLLEAIAKPAQTLAWGGRLLGSKRLAIRNLSVWPKAVWLGRHARRMGVNHIHVHWSSVPATMGMIAADVAKVPFSITAHRYDIAQGNLLSEKARRAGFIRAIDRDGADELFGQMAQTGVRPWILHMGVELPLAAAPVQAGALNPIRLVMAARFVEKKGHRVLFDAMQRLDQKGLKVTVDLFGSGPLEKVLQAEAETRGLGGAIRFAGVLDHNGLLLALVSGRYDAAVLPSIVANDGDKEGIPVFLMEAMACGVPVIATRSGGIWELVEEGEGILAPQRDAQALADAIGHVASNGEARARYAVNGKTKIARDFEIESCMQQLRARITALSAP
jgi:glycosyltransferase involved in cell wall biosynthesis